MLTLLVETKIEGRPGHGLPEPDNSIRGPRPDQ